MSLRKINIAEYRTERGLSFKNLPLSYQIFGREPGTAPVVLVCHALTGNSSVAGENGWWKALVGKNACIDLNVFTVVCFDIPGNGYNGFLIKDYTDVTIRDVAVWFLTGLNKLGVKSIFAGIGGSLGGSILWQMAIIEPELFENMIPIATDWKATDWLLAQCRVQTQILENSDKPVQDARIHAMTFYRTAESLKSKFGRRREDKSPIFEVESWLFHHGKTLQKRFHLQAYKLMNHLLTTADVETQFVNFQDQAKQITGTIHLVGIDTDGFYLDSEILDTYRTLREIKTNVFYNQIKSVHGHDAFLIEYEQLERLLHPVFKTRNNKNKLRNEYEYIG